MSSVSGWSDKIQSLDCTLREVWHQSCVFNEYGLSSDERIGRLRDEVERLRKELSRRERENARQKREIDGLRRQDECQKRGIEDLRRQLAAARLAGKRQAAPFAKDRPQGRGRRPGRRAGALYGRHARRRRPERVDQVLETRVPKACRDCGGSVEVTRVASQKSRLSQQVPHHHANGSL